MLPVQPSTAPGGPQLSGALGTHGPDQLHRGGLAADAAASISARGRGNAVVHMEPVNRHSIPVGVGPRHQCAAVLLVVQRMTSSRRRVLAAVRGGLLAGCAGPQTKTSGRTGAATSSSVPAVTATATPAVHLSPTTPSAVPPATRTEIMARYGHAVPHTWGL